MKLLDRYIFREILGYTLVGVGVFAFVLMTPELLRLSELLARESMGPVQTAKLFLSVLPPKLVWALPLGVLVGLLMGISRLAADRELMALQVSGVGLVRLLRPALVFALLGTLATLAITIGWGPAAARTLRQLQAELGARQLFFEVRPRVFEERLPERILYVQETENGGTQWKGVFLADLSDPETSKVTLAQTGLAIPGSGQQKMRLHLSKGATHEYALREPDRYSLSTFEESSLAMAVSAGGVKLEVRRNAEMSVAELWAASQQGPRWRSARADFYRRFVLPTSCLVFGLLAFPLGLLAQTSGRAVGFVLAIGFAISYYFLFLIGDRLAREGAIAPAVGVWMPNLVFLLLAIVLLHWLGRPRGGGSLAVIVRAWLARVGEKKRKQLALQPDGALLAQKGRAISSRWLRILDLYVVRGVLFHFLLAGTSLLLLFNLFSILEMVDDIAARQIPWSVVGRLIWYQTPQVVYWMTPLALLLAVLVELALLSKRNEVVAIKGAGISLYRIAAPVLVLALVLGGLLFWLDSTYLPTANQQREALRNYIKGRPPQTFFQAERRWIFGEAPRIYHYSFFDPGRNLLARLHVFELDPVDFSLRRRLFAERAHWEPLLQCWVLERGWERVFDGNQTVSYVPFDVAGFPELAEPPDYFKKEVRESDQMSWAELGDYIAELQQSGLDANRLVVQWHKKFAFPSIALVMVLLAFPFGLAAGQRGGAVGGIALGIGLGLLYWVMTGFFEALGNFALLPPVLAGWGPNMLFAAAGVYLILQVET